MNAVPGAAVPVFSSLDSPARRVPPNVALYSSFSLSACRHESRSSRKSAEARTNSLEELCYGREGPEGLQFSGRRNVTRRFAREKSSSKAVSGASHDRDSLSWMPKKQPTKGVKSFDIHQARGFIASGNVHASPYHDRDKVIAYDEGRVFHPFEEQQHHGSSGGKKHPRVPLPTKNRHLRMHNKVSVFEGIRQPSISGLSANNRAGASSWGVEDADVSPSNFNGQAIISYEASTQHGNKENIRRGSKFMSKMQEVLLNLEKKDDLLSKNLAIDQEVLRDESTRTQSGEGFQTATSEGKKTKERAVLESLKRNEKQSSKSVDSDIESSVRDENVTISRDDSRRSPLMKDGKAFQSKLGDAKSLLKENVKVGNEAQVVSFNLFSSSPSVPWEADRKYASTFKRLIPIRGGNVNPLTRRSRSIGSRSSPSRRSVNSRNVGDSHTATDVVDLSKLIGRDEQMESRFENREGKKLNDNKLTTQVTGVMDPSKLIGGDERMESWLENSEGTKLNDDQFTTQIAGDVDPSKLIGRDEQMESWFENREGIELNDDQIVSQKGAPAEEQVESINFDRSESDKDLSMHSHIDEAGAEANPPTHSSLFAASSQGSLRREVFPVDMILDTSEMGKGSNDSSSSSWHKHNLPDLPFDFQFSYSETPKAPILGYRETPYSPFGPCTMGRPWTGGPPPKPSKKKQWVFDSFNPPPKDKKGVKYVQDPGPYPEGQGPKRAKSREEIIGEPLTKEEIVYLVEKCERESRQINLGRDGLTHNMLDLIFCHWKRRRVCKIKCKGVPTVDMDNVKFHIEDKTGGKIIYQAGGVLYLFRGRNYNYKDRPQIPLMLWKPVTPLYPKLIQPAPEGLAEEEAQRLRVLGRKVQPMCRLGKNGVYLNLVKDVRAAFKVDELVRIDCRGLNPRDYKKIGAKLKDLVPCVLLSFDKEHILMWKGKQDLSIENGNLSRAPKLEPHLADDEEILKQSSVADEVNDDSICEEKVTNLVDEASYSAHAGEGETEEKMQQSYSKQESGSTLDYASQGVSTYSSGTDESSVLQIAAGQEQFHIVNIDKTHCSSSTKDEDHALSGTRKTNYGSNSQSLKEKVNVSSENTPLMGDRVCLYTTDSLSERHVTSRNLKQNTGSEQPNTSFEEMTKTVNSKLAEEGHKEFVPLEAAPSENRRGSEDGLANDEEVFNQCLDNQNDSVVHLDELWDHAFLSGMAVEVSEEGMDADLIVRKAAQLAKVAPLGPAYTIKLMYKLRLKRDEIRPNDILEVRFGRGKPQKIPKKGVKQKFQLPTLDVPGMGGLPVDELARLLAPKQTP